ncbi:MAG: hypothetical protein POELPBGB_00989 [Bacteroidia bacterium]|nr:hypothetical protein [Bacteroidia bacterium]
MNDTIKDIRCTTYIFRFSFLFLFIFFIHSSFAQSNLNGWSIGADAQYGFILSHRHSMGHLVRGHTPSFQITVSKQTIGNKYWQQHFRYPIIGYSFLFIDLKNNDQLGNAFALYPSITFTQNRQRKFMRYFKIGCGPGYISKVFDRVDNNKNNAIGSHINVFINFTYGFNWKPQRNLSIDGGLSFTHFSNASFTAPNLGINLPMLHLGASWNFNDGNIIYKKDSIAPPRERKWHYSVILSGGLKEISPAEGPKYGIASLNAEAIKPVSRKSRIGLGLDLFYDASLETKLKKDSADFSGMFAVVRPGLHFHYELKISEFSMFFDVGGYLYTRWKEDGYIYARPGIRYRVAKNILLGLALKTHYFKADFAEWGIGYEF